MAENIEDVLDIFDRVAEAYYSKEEFLEKLRSGRKLRVKYGIDIGSPVLHIGHAANLWLLRALQDLGHRAIFILSDFTPRVAGLSAAFEVPRADAEKNVTRLVAQAKMVLRPELAEIRRNTEWFSNLPLQQLKDFQERARLELGGGDDLDEHDLMPLVLQAYDSVAIEADIAVAGTDAVAGERLGRTLQQEKGQVPQTIVTTKAPPGLDGKLKQSKTLDNYIGLDHSAREKFGRLMDLPSYLIDDYLRIYTDISLRDIDVMKGTIEHHPNEAKLALAEAIVARYHGHEVADWEKEWFENTAGRMPDDIPALPVLTALMSALDLVAAAHPGGGADKTAARQIITRGIVELEGRSIVDADEMLQLEHGDVLKTGKRIWHRIEIVGISDLKTERLRLTELQIDDIDLLTKNLPEWELVKYLNRPLAKGATATDVRDIFKAIMDKREANAEQLLKIQVGEDMSKIIGLAHLQAEGDRVAQNILLEQQYRNTAIMREALIAASDFAFKNMDVSNIVFKDAFVHAATPREMETLRAQLTGVNTSGANTGSTFSITREDLERARARINPQAPQNTPVLQPGKPKPGTKV